MGHPILLSKDRKYIGILHKKDSDGDNFAHWSIDYSIVKTFFDPVFYKGNFGGKDDPWFCTDRKYNVILPYELT